MGMNIIVSDINVFETSNIVSGYYGVEYYDGWYPASQIYPKLNIKVSSY